LRITPRGYAKWRARDGVVRSTFRIAAVVRCAVA